MVEQHSDKTKSCGKMIPQHERTLFAALKNHLQIREPHPTTDFLPFFEDNKCGDGTQIMARLDRLYMFNYPLSFGTSPLWNLSN
jgi:hypothetical protein